MTESMKERVPGLEPASPRASPASQGTQKQGQPSPPCTAQSVTDERLLPHRRLSTMVPSHTSHLAEAGGSLQALWVPRQSSASAAGVREPLALTPAWACPPHLPAPAQPPSSPTATHGSCQGGVCEPAASSREHFTLPAASSVLCPVTQPSAGRSGTTSPATVQAQPQHPPKSRAGLSASVSNPGAPRGKEKGKNRVGF